MKLLNPAHPALGGALNAICSAISRVAEHTDNPKKLAILARAAAELIDVCGKEQHPHTEASITPMYGGDIHGKKT